MSLSKDGALDYGGFLCQTQDGQVCLSGPCFLMSSVSSIHQRKLLIGSSAGALSGGSIPQRIDVQDLDVDFFAFGA